MARVLVTGAAGFIGSHTVEHLLRARHAVVALDDLSWGSWHNLARAHGPLRRVEADVRDADRLTALLCTGRCDAIIHLAAWASVAVSIDRPAEAHAVNVGGTLAVLEAARIAGVRRVVLASSAAVYGHAPVAPIHEDRPFQPLSPYAAHKAAAELLCTAYRAAYGLETVVLRYFNPYGPRQPADSPNGGVVAAFARRLAAGEPIFIPGDGEQTRDFVHVADVAAVNVRAALGPDPGEGAINVGTGTETSVHALIEALCAALGVRPTLVSVPERPGDVRHSRADITRLRDRLGYTPRVSLAEGLRTLLADGGRLVSAAT
jgi:UDP-glucose 4-epimerase